MRAPAAGNEMASAFRLTAAVVLAVTLVRCLVLVLSPLNLYPDEAQYGGGRRRRTWVITPSRR
jgi:hypothetical protein